MALASRPVAPEVESLAQRCARLSVRIHAPARDTMALIRSARRLKRVHSELSRELSARRRQGITAGVVRAEEVLAEMERDLRRVLLEHPSLSSRQLQEAVARIADLAFTALDLLDLDA